MTQSALKPQIKARWAIAKTLDGRKKIVRPGVYELVHAGYEDRGRGIEPHPHLEKMMGKVTSEYRADRGISPDVPLNNYHQNQIYRELNRRLKK